MDPTACGSHTREPAVAVGLGIEVAPVRVDEPVIVLSDK
jgi:hypothetical protein